MERKAPDHRTQAGWAFGLLVARMPLVAEGAARLIEPGHYQISHPLGPQEGGMENSSEARRNWFLTHVDRTY